MPNRIIKESICTSENLDRLSSPEEVFFYRLIVNCDDHGRFDARAAILRARLFPLKLAAVSERQVAAWLRSLVEQRLVFLYECAGQPYLQVATWTKHQQVRTARSKYPEPDSNGYQLISDDISCSRNPIQTNPNPNPDPNPNREQRKARPSAAALREGFEVFWKSYPKKKSRNDAEKAFMKLAPDEQLLAIILARIEQAKTSEDWNKERGRFIPYPASFLNGRRWEDEATCVATDVATDGGSNGRGPQAVITGAAGLPGNRPAGAFADVDA